MQINWALLIFGAGLAVYGLYRLVKLSLRYRKVYASRRWPETRGTVTTGKVIGVKTNYYKGRPGGKHHWTEIRYAYTVLGAQYTGKFQIDSLSGTAASAAQNIEKFPVGAPLVVHYNPAKPKEYMTQYDQRNINNLLGVWIIIILLGLAFAILPLILVNK